MTNTHDLINKSTHMIAIAATTTNNTKSTDHMTIAYTHTDVRAHTKTNRDTHNKTGSTTNTHDNPTMIRVLLRSTLI